MSNRSRSNHLVVPQAAAALQQMKYEIAQQLGIPIPKDGYYGNYTTSDMGFIGGNMTKRLVQMAQHMMVSQDAVNK